MLQLSTKLNFNLFTRHISYKMNRPISMTRLLAAIIDMRTI